MENQQAISPQKLAKKALQDDNTPSFYMNGKTTAVVNMSLSTLKTLAHNLMATIQGIEEKLEQETPTLQELQERLSKE